MSGLRDKEAKKRNNCLKTFETKHTFASPCTGEDQCERHQLLREATSTAKIHILGTVNLTMVMKIS